MPNKHLLTITCLIIIITATGIKWWFMQPAIPADISFSIIDGRKINLSELHGRTIIINFWATTCDICRKELPGLIKLYNKYSGKGLEIIHIAMPYDPPNRVLDTANRNKIPFPVALDIHGDAVKAFGGIDATPTLFLITPDGELDLKIVGKTDMGRLEQRIMKLLPDPIQKAGQLEVES